MVNLIEHKTQNVEMSKKLKGVMSCGVFTNLYHVHQCLHQICDLDPDP